MRDTYNDLLITLENTPENNRTGLINALIVRYFSVTQLLKLRDMIGEVQVTLLEAQKEDKELAATAAACTPDDILNEL